MCVLVDDPQNCFYQFCPPLYLLIQKDVLSLPVANEYPEVATTFDDLDPHAPE